MDSQTLINIIEKSPSIQILRSKNLKSILIFLFETFGETSSIKSEALQFKLSNHLNNNSISLEDDSADEYKIETNEERAKRWIKNWTDNGFLSNYENEEGDVIYELSSYTTKALDWIETLKKEDYIGTESKFKALFNQLQELVEFTNEDREKRLELLRKRRQEIERQIQDLEMGKDVRVYEEYEIVPRYKALNRLSKELISDFSEVDSNFKDIIQQIYRQQTDNHKKQDTLKYIFDAHDELKVSHQGKSFYAFWEFLQSSDLQQQWDSGLENLHTALEIRNIKIDDDFLSKAQSRLFDAGTKVVISNNRMAERLSRIVTQNEIANSAEITKLLKRIRKRLDELRADGKSSDASFYIEDIKLSLPMERPLKIENGKETIYDQKPTEAAIKLDNLLELSKIINAKHIDKDVLRKRISEAIATASQATLHSIIESNGGIRQGLAEVIAYLSVAEEFTTVTDPVKKHSITFDKENLKYIYIPEVIISK